MTVKALLEVLNNDVCVIIRESDNTQVAEFNRDSYKAIADKYLSAEIGDLEVFTKNTVLTFEITLKEAAQVVTPPTETKTTTDTSTEQTGNTEGGA